MAKNLLIVESPAKAKTIEKILGPDFIVKSSFGHVRDLDKDSKDSKAIDVANNYKPNYIITPDKYKVVKDLKDAMSKVDDVWLATDDDREGEAISWHLCEVLKLNPKTTKRIVFREITKPGITKAVQQPRLLDLDLVDAQQARRILDRLVGFELSELLWRKVKPSLSAGRVQSVAVKLVVERERDIRDFQATPFFKVVAYFDVEGASGKPVVLKAELSNRFDVESDAEAFLQKCLPPTEYNIRGIEVKPAKRKPAEPFTTSTLQQEASRKLYMGVQRTMSVAQKLYEAGHITYMRTDSTSLSESAIASIEQEIIKSYGKQYSQPRRFKTNKAGAQEAHEAIRPTYIEKQVVSQDRDEQRLYELIWKRTIASQMSDAELERTTVDIAVSSIKDAKFEAVGEVIKFEGFLKVYREDTDDDDTNEDTTPLLPPLKVGQRLPLKEMIATERFTRPAPRFTEASLVKKLEELGIGRPSTYAAIISKIMEETRGYVVKENRDGMPRPYRVLTLKGSEIAKRNDSENTGAEKNKLFPTDMGMLVTEFLDQHFDDVMNYKFTANVEEILDEVADGKKNWVKVIDGLYKPFHSHVLEVREGAERVSGERILGTDPATGLTVLVRLGKFGPLVQIGKQEELEEGTKPRYGNLKPGTSLETVTMSEAMKSFEFPKVLGQYENLDLTVGEGRYGPYVKWGEAFISLPKGEDPQSVDLERAIAIVGTKKAADAPIGYFQEQPITKGTGRFGPFIKWAGLYINIPKAYNVATITEAQAHVLIEAKVDKEANKFIQAWPEEDIFIERGRWGAFIRAGKGKNNMFKLPSGAQGKMTDDEAAVITLAEVKKVLEGQGWAAAAKAAKTAAKKTTTTAKKAPARKK